MDTVFFILYLLLAFALGALLGWYVSRLRRGKGHAGQAALADQADPEQLAAQVERLTGQLTDVTGQLNETKVELAASQSAETASAKQVAYFQSLVAQLRQDEQDRMRRQAQEEQTRLQELGRKDQQLKQEQLAHQQDVAARSKIQDEANEHVAKLMSPISKNLDSLRARIDSIEQDRIKESASVSDQLNALKEQQTDLHAQTRELTSVLGNNQARGQWGEAQLRNLVEAAGMTEHVDYDTQFTVQNDKGGNSRPDMIIRLPGKRVIPVDAKTPLQGYQRAMGEDRSTKDGRLAYARDMQDNVAEIRKHINDLAARDYPSSFEQTPDMTIAFIPSEAVLSAALETDGALLDYAYSRRVALCSPVSLWAVLKAVAHTWQQVKLGEDAKNLYKVCQELYAGFRTMGRYVTDLGKNLTKAVGSYNQLVGNLERTILPKARRLQGIDPKKIEPIGQLEGEKSSVRTVSAPELNPEAIVDAKVVGISDAKTASSAQSQGQAQSPSRTPSSDVPYPASSGSDGSEGPDGDTEADDDE